MLTRVGEIEIWRSLDWQGLFWPPDELFINAPPGVADTIEALAPGTVDADSGRIDLPVQGFVVKTPDHVIVVDTCIGNDKTSGSQPFWDGLTDTKFMSGLAEAGVTPDEVDYVLFTHMHIDHIGWNTRRVEGEWVPTFPNATYLMPAADEQSMRGRGFAAYDESIAPVIEAGLAEFIDAEYRLGDALSLIATPGHTPGHVSVLLQSKGEEAVLIGDAFHTTAQCQHPQWHFKYDWDADVAETSRRALMTTCAKHAWTVIGTHFVLPSMGRVEADGDVFRWIDSGH
ncbi:MAG: MBL fold metallo-hydrolase [Pseudomonadota bacterium]